jgi:hypothetical protein
VQEKCRFADGPGAEQRFFDEIAAFQEVLSAVLVQLMSETEGILTLTKKENRGLRPRLPGVRLLEGCVPAGVRS